MVRKLRTLLGLLALLAWTATDSLAQADLYTQTINQTLQTMDLSNRLFQMRQASKGGGSRGTTQSASGRGQARRPVSNTAQGKTTFYPVATSIMPAAVARGIYPTVGHPAERAALEADFSRMLFAYNSRMRAEGSGIYDVAGAASFMIINCHKAYSDGRELTAAQKDGVRQHMRKVLLESADFQQLTNSRKQQLYESYAMMGMYVMTNYDEARRQGDRKRLAELRQLAQKQIEERLKSPIDRISFTNDGIEYR